MSDDTANGLRHLDGGVLAEHTYRLGRQRNRLDGHTGRLNNLEERLEAFDRRLLAVKACLDDLQPARPVDLAGAEGEAPEPEEFFGRFVGAIPVKSLRRVLDGPWGPGSVVSYCDDVAAVRAWLDRLEGSR